MATLAPAQPAFAPSVPQTMEELGIPQALVMDLMLRRLLLEGHSTLQILSSKLKLAVPIVDIVFRHMRQQQLVEVRGMLGNDYQFALSAAGRALASERFQISQYAGAAPVSLKDYHSATHAQVAHVHVDRKTLRDAYSDLVMTDRQLDQIGPAIIAQTSVFLYGPSGNGKTSLAERMLRVYTDVVYIPYAIEVDGQIISLYDPVVHHKVETEEDPDIDARWILCRRPCIVVGGELIPSMVELRLDEASGIYAAPLQMKANNGIFIIDDFGRQLMSPRDLLNRWIVPLDRRIDYLTLRYGVKFQIPFELLVVFSTNLDPRDLADEAFLRRIRNKIYVEPVDENVFDEIFRRVVEARSLPTEIDSAEFLRTVCLREGRGELRACYPVDICNILSSISRYEGRPIRMTKSELERAASLYFAKT
ncbi:MAG: AAA family ATPase [Acidobacteria bacterium]|nr:AAA family ATPase [Acidobacteriota bacterium]MBI3281615.1 AAA family ATPase [Acidobacteriota bacterium]